MVDTGEFRSSINDWSVEDSSPKRPNRLYWLDGSQFLHTNEHALTVSRSSSRKDMIWSMSSGTWSVIEHGAEPPYIMRRFWTRFERFETLVMEVMEVPVNWFWTGFDQDVSFCNYMSNVHETGPS